MSHSHSVSDAFDQPAAFSSTTAAVLSIVLSVTAGSADVISFLGLGGLFNSHITGNLAVLAVRVVNGGTAPLALVLSVPVFVVVVFLARLLALRLQSTGLPPLPPLLLLQLVLLAACLVLCVSSAPLAESTPTQVLAGMLGVSAMAVQNALVLSTLTGAAPTAAMTANVTRFALAVAELVRRRSQRQMEAARNQLENTWPAIVGFLAGAGLGAAAEAHVGLWAFGLPVGTALLALILGAVATGVLKRPSGLAYHRADEATFRRILVPLDGSPLAERAVQHATELATAARGSVVLVRAADRSYHPRPGHPNDDDGQARAYLEEVRRQLRPTGVTAEVAAPHGHAPEALLAEIAHQEPDLIVMATHSRSGLRHAALGRVPEAVVASGQAPVLLLRQDAMDGEPPSGRGFSSIVGRRVLALLDGSAFAETALPAALGLARVLESELILFKAIEVYSVPYAVPTELMTVSDLDVQLAWDASFDVNEAEAYLSLVRRRLKRLAPNTPVQIRVQVGDLIEQIRATKAEADIGLIVMATHGRSGLAQALRGSTVHDVLRATACPLVVIHSAVRPLADATRSPPLED